MSIRHLITEEPLPGVSAEELTFRREAFKLGNQLEKEGEKFFFGLLMQNSALSLEDWEAMLRHLDVLARNLEQIRALARCVAALQKPKTPP